ncbi:MAG: hypothetical protein LBJ87_08805 [bacterium]|nr:hypothetical protein [bacterium]
MIREALEVVDGGQASPEVAQRLHDALDAVSDGMPPEYTARLLYGALQGWPLS